MNPYRIPLPKYIDERGQVKAPSDDEWTIYDREIERLHKKEGLSQDAIMLYLFDKHDLAVSRNLLQKRMAKILHLRSDHKAKRKQRRNGNGFANSLRSLPPTTALDDNNQTILNQDLYSAQVAPDHVTLQPVSAGPVGHNAAINRHLQTSAGASTTYFEAPDFNFDFGPGHVEPSPFRPGAEQVLHFLPEDELMPDLDENLNLPPSGDTQHPEGRRFQNRKGRQPLHQAAQSGSWRMVKSLLEAGCNVNVTDIEGITPLHLAVLAKDPDTVSLLLEREANVHAATYESQSVPLSLAAETGNAAITNRLLDFGACSDVAVAEGWTPMLIACAEGHSAVVNLFIIAGSNVALRNSKTGRQAIHYAASGGHVQIIDRLIKCNPPASLDAKDWNGVTPLYLAAFNGHLSAARHLLQEGATVQTEETKFHSSAVHCAALQGHAPVVRLLHEHGACMDVELNYKITPLWLAAYLGHTQIVNFLLTHAKVNVNAVNLDSGHSVLIAAIVENHPACAELLLDHDADIKYQCSDGQDAMLAACHRRMTSIAVRLLEKGATTSVQHSSTGSRPLHGAAQGGDVRLIRALLKSSDDVDARTKDGVTAVFLAAQDGFADIVKVLVEEGKADLNIADDDLRRPIHQAAQQGHLEVVSFLVEHGTDVNARTLHDLTALKLAASNGHREVVEFLIKRGAQLEAADEFTGRTPIYYAIRAKSFSRSLDLVSLMLEKGANGKHLAKTGISPLWLALGQKNVEICKHLLATIRDYPGTTEAETGVNELHLASMLGDLELFTDLLHIQADFDTPEKEGQTPLYIAAEQGHGNIVGLLLQKGADQFIRHKQLEYLPLHLAAWGGHLEVVKRLLSANQTTDDPHRSTESRHTFGCIDAVSAQGFTSLFLAAQAGRTEIVRCFLTEHRPDIHIRSRDGYQAIHQAAENGHEEILTLLLDHGADKNSEAVNRVTPLLLACENNHPGIVDILIRRGASLTVEAIMPRKKLEHNKDGEKDQDE